MGKISDNVPSAALPAFIWDLDGTLFDSYDVIVSSLQEAYRSFEIELDKRDILREIKSASVSALIKKVEREKGPDFMTVKSRFAEVEEQKVLEIREVSHASEVLLFLKEKGIPSFIFTHRGRTTPVILNNLNLSEYFDEIITAEDDFARKPDPSAVLYLIRRHGLDKDNTFYVGDRTLDIECAVNAGIKSILYLPEGSLVKPTGKETYIVKDLNEIAALFS